MESTEKIRVMVADDHAVVREGLVQLLNSQRDIEVVGEASDGVTAVDRVRYCSPHVIVMDVTMPRQSGPKATAEILNRYPRVRVVALSMHEDPCYLREMMECGASGYVLKRSVVDDLLRAVRTVYAGNVYFDPSLAGRLVNGLSRKNSLRGELQGIGLSDREEEVLRLLARGYSHKEIAAQLSISIKTVETYKARSMEKLSLQSRVDIIRYARDSGWLDDF